MALSVLVVASAAGAVDPATRPRRVLEIFERNPQLGPIYGAFQAEFRVALGAGFGVELHEETFDSSRASDARYRAAFRGWLASEFEESPPDVIVAVGMNPLGFLADPGANPWPSVPVLFGTVDDRAPALRSLPRGFTGVVEHIPVRETLELALQLFPDTRRVVLFGGVSPPDRFCEEVMLEEAARYAGRLEVVDLVGKPTTELLTRVRALPEGSILLGISYEVDAEGQRWNGRRIVKLLADTGRAPVFSVYREILGAGMLGGVVADFGDTGRRVAGMATRILAGEPTTTLAVDRAGPYRAVIDGRELDRWNVPDERVPPGAEIQFREVGAWRRYRWQLVAVVSALGLQSLLIGGLLVERRGRRAAERAARENLAQVAHMNRIGAIGELTGSFAHEVNTPLGAVLNNAQAARRFMKGVPDSPACKEVIACLDDIVGDARRAGEVVQRMRSALRRQESHQTTVDFSAVIRDAVRLVEAEVRDRDVVLALDVAPELPAVTGDEVQLVQVLVNLLMNALDALMTVPQEHRRIMIASVPASRGLEIRVVDSGPGIPPQQIDKIFEPFFTTKAGGLGLGLAISRSIVEAHGGRMHVARVAPTGTVFHVFLPAQRALADAERTVSAAAVPARNMRESPEHQGVGTTAQEAAASAPGEQR